MSLSYEDICGLITELSDPEPPEDPELESLPGSHGRYYHFLYRLSEEIGDALGYWVVFGVHKATCCAHIAAANPGTSLVAIDKNRTIHAARIAERYGFTYRVHNSHSPLTMQYFQSHSDHIGVVFFDTTHLDWVVLGEWERVRPFTGGHTILIFDDVHAAEDSVMKAVKEIPGEYFDLDHLHADLGFGVKVQ